MLTATCHCGAVEIVVSRLIIVLLSFPLAACAGLSERADPGSDVPEAISPAGPAFQDAPTYGDAVLLWKSPEDVNAWIGARFAYDTSRAMALSETQRNGTRAIAIRPPHELFALPSGVCVDLARFAVETLRQIDPGTNPKFVMVEFAPITLAGSTLRLHWLASFMRHGKYYFFADAKRPGHIAGPYASLSDFMRDYAQYRGRDIVSFQEQESYQRKQRTLAAKQPRAP